MNHLKAETDNLISVFNNEYDSYGFEIETNMPSVVEQVDICWLLDLLYYAATIFDLDRDSQSVL